MANAGVFVSIGADGDLRIERGYVRREDEAAFATGPDREFRDGADRPAALGTVTVAGTPADSDETASEEDGIKPLPDRLVAELTAYRTLALREALANDPTWLSSPCSTPCASPFYRYGTCTCLEITAKSTGFGVQSPGLNDTALAQAINERQERWAKRLPENTAALWDMLLVLGGDDRMALFAHCASVSVNAVHEAWNRSPGRDAHANQLAHSVGLDLVAAGWAPTVENYFGRVTKAVLSSYDGETFLNDICEAVVRALPAGDPLLSNVESILQSTGVVSGEFGFVQAYAKKKAEMSAWLADEDSHVRAFAESYLRLLDRSVAAEQRRGEESIEMRKRIYEDPGDADETQI